jgi:exopolyphosphatase/guanosine-5'-triphosphate,3'-diphosphate pyrophosphatase
MSRIAAIDLGSNALRLRIVETSSGDPESFREITSLRAAVRLGGDVFSGGKLSAQTISQACAALADFKKAMDIAGVEAYRACATSAVREAENGLTLVERARREAGIDLEIIEGIEEARLIQLAVVRRMRLEERTALLVDVGGGSTELTCFSGGRAIWARSLPLGSVRLLETFLRDTPTVESRQASLLRETIDRALAEPFTALAGTTFDEVIGTGGNVETLAELCPADPTTTAERRTGAMKRIDVAKMSVLLKELCGLTADERRQKYGLRPDRADTIVPASFIFARTASLFGADGIAAPGVGLKEGILLDLLDRVTGAADPKVDDHAVVEACARLGKRFQYDEKHGRHVSHLAARLFDDCEPLHLLAPRDRILLRAAATLHDIGDFIRYEGHHKHSYYIISQSDIMGLSSAERAIVANVARYHRKGAPDPNHPNFRDLDKDARAKVRSLTALLRIADGLDREHLGRVHDLRAEVDTLRKRIVLHLQGDEERELEEWTVQQKSDLFREVFGLDVVLAENLGNGPRSEPERAPKRAAKK